MNNALGVGIGIVYSGLLQKAISVYYEKEQVDKMCGKKDILYPQQYDTTCEKNRKEKLNEIDKISFGPIMSIVIISIIVSVMLKKYNYTVSFGLGLGSILSLIYNVVLNWYRFDDKQRLFTYTISFAVLVLAAIKYYTK